MANKNNVIEEIQELVQQIKSEYQEGVDFEIVDKRNNEYSRWVEVKSSKLKKVLREKFSIPFQVKGLFLDYHRSDSQNNWFTYRVEEHSEKEETDSLIALEKSESWKNETENCKQCNQLVYKKEGWIRQWDGRKITGEPSPNVIAHFHPECAKKYFADKEQPNENNVQMKEKLLRNLDKLCFDPDGYLANNECLKTDEAEEEYQKIFASDNWKNRYLKIVIDGEQIDLENWDNACPEYYEVKKELIKKIKSEIKQNPSEWKIEKGKNENCSVESNNRLIKHVSGRRHWKFAISYLWGGNNSERIKHWTEIEALINGSKLPDKNNKPTDTDELETEKIKNIFQKLNIKKISLKNGKLVITHNNNEMRNLQQIFHDSKLLEIMNFCQRNNKNKITRESLNIDSNNTSTSPNNPKSNNHQLAIGLALGAGAVILVGVVVYFTRKRKKK